MSSNTEVGARRLLKVGLVFACLSITANTALL
jgi:hypothetical protein